MHVFGLDALGELVHYYWSPEYSWDAGNLTSTIGASSQFRLSGDPAAINLWDSNTPTQHVFGRNSEGDLVHYYWSPQASWAAENLTARSGIGEASRLVGDPIAVNLDLDNTPTQHVFGRASEGDLVHYYWSPQASWAAENLTARSGIGEAFRLVGKIAAANHRVDGEHTQHVFGLNVEGDLVHYYWSPQASWAAENLTARSGIGKAFRLEGSPVIATPAAAWLQVVRDRDFLISKHVFGLNPNGDLVHYYWSPQASWAAENLTARSGIGEAFRVVGEPIAVDLVEDRTPTQHIFALNTRGHLVHYYWSSRAGWAAEDLTARVGLGASVRLMEGLSFSVVKRDAERGTHHVFARNSEGELIHYFWSAEVGWRAENLNGGAYRERRILSAPTALEFPSEPPTQHVFGRNHSGELIHYYWSVDRGWTVENTTTLTSRGQSYRLTGNPIPTALPER